MNLPLTSRGSNPQSPAIGHALEKFITKATAPPREPLHLMTISPAGCGGRQAACKGYTLGACFFMRLIQMPANPSPNRASVAGAGT